MRPVLVIEHGDDARPGRLADLGGHSALLVLGCRMAAWEDDAGAAGGGG